MKVIRIGTLAGLPALMQTRRFLERVYRMYPALRMPGAIETVEFMPEGYGHAAPDGTCFNLTGALSRKMETALLSGDIDMAVCPVDNMRLSEDNNFKTACYMPREAPWDCLYSGGKYKTFADMKCGEKIAVCDLRAAAFVSSIRSDLNVSVLLYPDCGLSPEILKKGEYDAMLIPLSLFRRCGFENDNVTVFDNGETIPGAGSGAVCIEIKSDNLKTADFLEKLNDEFSEKAVIAERAFLSALDLKKELPVAVHAFFKDKDTLFIRTAVLKPDGSDVITEEVASHAAEYREAGKNAGDKAADIINCGFCDV